MTKLYVLAYPAGACGDFLGGRIWAEGTHWDKQYARDLPTFGKKDLNTYWYRNQIHDVMGIDDKPTQGVTVKFIDDRYESIPANTYLTNLNEQQSKMVWDEIEKKFSGNILSTTHSKRNQYIWNDDKVKYFSINVPVKSVSADITDSLRTVKSVFCPIFDPSSYTKRPIDDPIFLKYKPEIPKYTWSEFERRGWATLWEAAEMRGHNYDYTVKRPMPNPKLWLEKKVGLANLFKFNNIKDSINLDLLYKKDNAELKRMFNMFDVETYDEEIIWDYIDENIKIYESININGDWKQYIINYISERIF